jgi:hypothetical protein
MGKTVDTSGGCTLPVTKSVSMVSVLALAFFMFLTAADVLGRFLLSAPIPGAIEVNNL